MSETSDPYSVSIRYPQEYEEGHSASHPCIRVKIRVRR